MGVLGVYHPQCYTVCLALIQLALMEVVVQGTLSRVPATGGQVEVEIHQEVVSPLNVVPVQDTRDRVPVVGSVSLG